MEPTSSSRGGLRPLSKAFFGFLAKKDLIGKKKIYREKTFGGINFAKEVFLSKVLYFGKKKFSGKKYLL